MASIEEENPVKDSEGKVTECVKIDQIHKEYLEEESGKNRKQWSEREMSECTISEMGQFWMTGFGI